MLSPRCQSPQPVQPFSFYSRGLPKVIPSSNQARSRRFRSPGACKPPCPSSSLSARRVPAQASSLLGKPPSRRAGSPQPNASPARDGESSRSQGHRVPFCSSSCNSPLPCSLTLYRDSFLFLSFSSSAYNNRSLPPPVFARPLIRLCYTSPCPGPPSFLPISFTYSFDAQLDLFYQQSFYSSTLSLDEDTHTSVIATLYLPF
jgi:hypothetical protein